MTRLLRTLGLLTTVVAWALAAPGHAQTQEIAPGKRYAGGQRVGSSLFGVSFVIPEGWVGAMSPDGEGFIVGHDTEPGMILIRAEPGQSVESMVAQLASPLTVSEDLVLVPRGEPAVNGKVVSGDYADAGGGGFIGHGQVVVDERGTATAFVAMGPAAMAPKYAKLLAGLVRSHRALSAKEVAQSGGVWRQRLAGRALTYYRTKGSHSIRRRLSLCPTGTYSYKSNETYTSGGFSDFSAVGRGGDAGQWEVRGETLVFTSRDGSHSTRALSRRGEQTHLDGQRWLVTGDAECP